MSTATAEKPKQTFKTIMIGPDLAEKMLSGNVHNRTIRNSAVERYSRDMKNGRWLESTGETIKYDLEGRMIDGQHRLWAVIDAKVTLNFVVAYNCQEEAQAVIDGALPRTMADTMKLAYGRDDVGNTALAVAKALARVKFNERVVLTKQEVVAAFEQHEAAIAFAVSAFSRKIRFITTAPVLTVIARAWYSQDKTRLKRFCEVLDSGKAESVPEHAALLLRDWLLMKAPIRKGVKDISRDGQIYAKTQRAVAAYLNDEEITMLYATAAELFPLPSEKAPKRAAAGTLVKKKARESNYGQRIKSKLAKLQRPAGEARVASV